MDEIPFIEKALLTAQVNLRMEERLKQEIELLKVQHKVDVHEMVRNYLRKELPRVRKRLEASA